MLLKSVKFTSTSGLSVPQGAGVGGQRGFPWVTYSWTKFLPLSKGLTLLSAKQSCAMVPHSGAAAHPCWFLGASHRTYFKPGYFEVHALLRLNNVKLHNPRAGLLASYFKSPIIWNMQTFPLYQAGLLNILLLETCMVYGLYTVRELSFIKIDC